MMTSAGITFSGVNPAIQDPAVKAASRKPAQPEAAPAGPVSQAGTVSLSPMHFSGRKPVRFGNALSTDRTVEFRLTTPVNARTVGKVLQSQMFQVMAKKQAGENSTLKLALNAAMGNADSYGDMDYAALADVPVLLPDAYKQDVIITHAAGPASVKALVTTTGKRFMQSGASLSIGPTMARGGSEPVRVTNEQLGISAELMNAYRRDLEWLIMERTGATDRTQVEQDLKDGKSLNALDALAYGSKGLVDYVIVGHDDVITRQELDRAYAEEGIATTPEKRRWNRNLSNWKKLKTVPLAEAYPQGLPDTPQSSVKSLSELKPPKAPKQANAKRFSLGKQKDAAQGASQEDKKLGIHLMGDLEGGIDGFVGDVPIRSEVEDTPGKPVPQRYVIENMPEGLNGILSGDVIHFTTPFDLNGSQQVVRALEYLGMQKAQNNDRSPVRILVNSPGGMVLACQEIRDEINALKDQGILVDVITYGMASSGGSWTLSSATGARLATPNARVMIHQANNAITGGTAEERNSTMIGLNDATDTYQQIVAEASGRPLEDVREDFEVDMWLNPVEALFYGPKGLTDGILVGPDTVVSRDAVESYLLEKLGSKEAVDEYVEKAINRRRTPDRVVDADEFEEKYGDDPFKNPLATIKAIVSRGGARPMGESGSAKVKASAAATAKAKPGPVEYFHVFTPAQPPTPKMVLRPEGEG